MRLIFGLTSCAARLRSLHNALAPLLVGSPESEPPGSPNLSPPASVRHPLGPRHGGRVESGPRLAVPAPQGYAPGPVSPGPPPPPGPRRPPPPGHSPLRPHRRPPAQNHGDEGLAHPSFRD